MRRSSAPSSPIQFISNLQHHLRRLFMLGILTAPARRVSQRLAKAIAIQTFPNFEISNEQSERPANSVDAASQLFELRVVHDVSPSLR